MNWAQRAALSLDLVVLIWFYYRQRLASGRYSKVRTIWPKVWLSLLWAPAIIGALDLLWLNIPSPEATTVREQYWPEDKRHGLAAVGYALSQPVDHVLCPGLNWGCRFLTVDHRTLVDHVWKGEAIADLRAGSGNTKAAIAAIEGAFFRNRVLRFAKLDESRLYGADLIDADLRHATLQNTNLQEARLAGVQLQGADLRGAQLQGADLHYAHLQGVRLVVAKLQGADLGGAQLQGADLDYAHLQAANLNAAELQGATLNWANLESASLGGVLAWRADPRTAFAHGAHIEGVITDPKEICMDHVCNWGDAFGRLEQGFDLDIPEGNARSYALQRIQILDQAKPLQGGQEMAQHWAILQSASPALDLYKKELAEQWRKIGCAADGAPYVLTKLTYALMRVPNPYDGPEAGPALQQLSQGSPRVRELAAAFLKEDCAGAHGISEETRTQLMALRDGSAQRTGALNPP